MMELKGKKGTARFDPKEAIGKTLLDLALRQDIGWGFSCTRGTCARCRCLIQEGADLLEEATDEEWDRLEPEELVQGYRLGCQARVKRAGLITALHKPYFPT